MPRPRWSHPRFRVLEKLGEGGMGTVFLAEDLLEGGRRVALKTYPGEKFSDLLQKEFLSLRRLRHPGIARAYHFGLSKLNDHPFFTMEYLQGTPLDTYLQDTFGPSASRWTANDGDRLLSTTDLFLQTAVALDHLHRHDLLHLDVKPGNILVLDPAEEDSPPLAVLIDLGLARGEGKRQQNTRGTLPYMAPERFRGGDLDPRTDLYSLGATFYKALTGRPAFDAKTVREVIQDHLHSTPPAAPEVPSTVERILKKLLAKDPAHRFKSAAALVSALKSFRTDLSPSRPILLPQAEETSLVGRTAEIDEISGWLDLVPRDQVILAIIGSAGFGKSRLLEEAEILVTTRGYPAIFLRTPDGDPLELIRSLLLRTATLFPPSRREMSENRFLFGRHGIVTELPNRQMKAPSSAPFHSSASAEILAPARRQATRWLASKMLSENLFILLDDVDRGGDSTAKFLVSLARSISSTGGGQGRRGGIISSRRNGNLGEDPLERQILLGPLTDEAVKRWLDRLEHAAGLTDSEKEGLLQRAQGIPLLVSLELFAASAQGTITNRESTAPLSPQERVRLFIHEVRGPARRVIETLSLFSAPPSLRRLSLALDWKVSTLAREVRMLESCGLLRGDRSGCVCFLYEPAGEWVVESLTPTKVRKLHERLASLEAQTKEEIVARAFHFFEAGKAKEGLRDATTILDLKPLDPVRRSPLALEVLARAGASPSAPVALRYRFQVAYAELLIERGRLVDAREVLESLLKTRPGHQSGKRIRLKLALARTAHLLGDVEEAERELLGCLELLPKRSATTDHLALYAELALLAHFKQDPDRAADWARRGVDLWAALSTQARQAARQQAVHLHGVLGQVAIRHFRFKEAIATLEAGEKLARGFPVNACLLLNNLGLAYHLASRFSEALSTFEKASRLTRELSDENMRVPIACNVAQIQAKLGNFSEARSNLKDLEALPAVKESGRLRLHVAYSRALVDSFQDGPSLQTWEQVQQLANDVGDRFLRTFVHLYKAEAAMSRGLWSEARKLLDGLLAEKIQVRRLALTRLAFLESVLGRSTQARDALGRLSDGDQRDQTDSDDLLSAWNRLFKAMAFVELKEFDDAKAHLDHAGVFFKKKRILPGVIEVLLSLAETSLLAGNLTSCERSLKEIEVHLKKHSRSSDLRFSRIRSPLIRARLELLRPASHSDRKRLESTVGDLLAQAEGEPAFEDLARMQVQTACTRLGLARLTGSLAAIRVAGNQLSAVRHDLAASLSDSDRDSFLAVDEMDKAGLKPLDVPGAIRPDGCWEIHVQEAMEKILETSGDAATDSWLVAVLETASRALEGALSCLIGVEDRGTKSRQPRLIAAWPPETFRKRIPNRLLSHLPSITTAGRWQEFLPMGEQALSVVGLQVRSDIRTWICCPLGDDSLDIGRLLVLSERPLEEFSRGDLRFLHLVGRCILSRWISSTESRSKSTPVSQETVEMTRSLERTRLRQDAEPMGQRLASLEVVAKSPAMKKVLQTVLSLKASDLPVLVTGEAGTGKDTVARLVHETSQRAPGPFVVQSLGSIPDGLVEADLFGHKQGAFTGADKTRSGFLLQAQGGTFLIDEVGESSPEVQQKLLRILEEKRIRPVGGERFIDLDVRFLATTQRDLEAMVRRGEFRRDLYYRLCGVQIHIKPLRERPEDVLPLLRQFFFKHSGFQPRITRPVKQRLLSYSWPGNVRELEIVVQRLGIRKDLEKKALGIADLQAAMSSPSQPGPIASGLFRTYSYEELKRDLDLAYFKHLFGVHKGRIDRVAEVLGTSTRSLYRRLERYGVRPKDILGELERDSRS